MGARFFDGLVSPVIAGLAGLMIGEVFLPTNAAPADTPIFTQFSGVQWTKMHPELGDASSEIAILHEDPKTHATQLLIRAPKALHVRKHWHSANETHTIITGTAAFECDGKKAEFGPGGFNYIPARRVHEAWLAAGAVIFITLAGPWDQHWVEGPPTAADLMP
ncbi:MAG TPA: cupin domain-containing protein [Methylocella sp.]|nr:cupin domain-containing protein [Methylocella sp.]